MIIGGLTFISSCDVCQTGESQKAEEGDIYFSALPANGTQPSIFRINADGTNLREVVRNAYLYSAPSRDKKLVYLSENSLGERYVYISNIDGSNARLIGADYWDSRQYPVLSPDGSRVTVYTGRRSLYIINNLTEMIKVTTKFCEETLPSFSPDGSKLAIIEGAELYNPLTVKIFDITKNPPAVIAEKIFSTGLIKWNGECSIDWTSDGEYISYVLTDNTYFDYVHIAPWYNLDNEQVIEMPGAGAWMPSLHRDRTKFVYAGRDGNIWLYFLNDDLKKTKNLTSSTSSIGYNIYPQWAPDGRNVFYSKYFRDDANMIHATLEIVDTGTDPPHIRVLGNNIFRAFWNRK